jgi:HlyD family secretion protein
MLTKLASAVILGGLFACHAHDPADVLYGTLERHRIEISAEAHEIITELDASEGMHVPAGRILGRLDPAAIQARVREAQASVAQARERLQELARGSRRQEIVEARAALDAANAELSTQSREYDRLGGLVTERLVSESVLEQALARRESAKGAQQQASARLALRIEGARVEAIAQANAALEASQAQLEEVQLSARRHDIVAPVSGTIEALPYRKGERPAAGATVIVLLADEPAFARVYVPAGRRLQFVAGTKAQVNIDGGVDAIEGTVRFISAQAAYTPYFALTQRERARLSYLAEIELPSRRDLPTGIPVQVLSIRAPR